MKFIYLFSLLFIVACNGTKSPEEDIIQNQINANVTEVTAQGSKGNYTFYVTLKSDETGCDQYADWWEVLNAKGELVYRRVLLHSHPDSQPFTRSGNPVNVTENDRLYIRAHMNKLGYQGDVFSGSVSTGFLKEVNPPEFERALEKQQPLPNGCAF